MTRMDRVRSENIRGSARACKEMKPEAEMVWFDELAGRRPRGRAERRFMDAVKEDMGLADDGEEEAGDGARWRQMIGQKTLKGTGQRRKKTVNEMFNLSDRLLCSSAVLK